MCIIDSPYARRINAYKTDEVDVVSDMNLNTINEHGLKGYLSDTAYAYENFAFSLHKNNFEFNELKDLKNHSLLSWQDAAIHLGEAYANICLLYKSDAADELLCVDPVGCRYIQQKTSTMITEYRNKTT